jgi:NAD(P)-dependent dehydrogenase (short-subunit alcohol dehydrogenase family)
MEAGMSESRSSTDYDGFMDVIRPFFNGRATSRQATGRLAGQTVVVIGGSGGIGFETARQARAEGARIVLAARDPERLRHAAQILRARSSMAFDANDPGALRRFFDGLDGPLDHVMVTAGRPRYGPLAEMEAGAVRAAVSEHMSLALEAARHAGARVRAGGTLLLMSGTGGRHPNAGYAIASAVTAAMPALTASLALELAPVRVNLIAPGFVDTPLSASILGEQLEARRAELRATLPIRRVVGPDDVAALAVHLMVNTALTGATYDVDGGQQLLA